MGTSSDCMLGAGVTMPFFLLLCTGFFDAMLFFLLSVRARSLLRFLADRILLETDCGGLTAERLERRCVITFGYI